MVLVHRQNSSILPEAKENMETILVALLQIQSLTQSIQTSVIHIFDEYKQHNATIWHLICGTTVQFDVELNQVPNDMFSVPIRRSQTLHTVFSAFPMKLITQRNIGEIQHKWMNETQRYLSTSHSIRIDQ